MTQDSSVAVQETLDPQDWQSMRALGHRMLDDMLDYVRTVRQRPVWQPIPRRVKDQFNQRVPLDPQPPEEI
jgi:aromatic-L-amino-acid decarboxylase